MNALSNAFNSVVAGAQRLTGDNSSLFPEKYIEIQVGTETVRIENKSELTKNLVTVGDLYQYVKDQRLPLFVGWNDYGTFDVQQHDLLFNHQLYPKETKLSDIHYQENWCNFSVDLTVLACKQLNQMPEFAKEDAKWAVVSQDNWIQNREHLVLTRTAKKFDKSLNDDREVLNREMSWWQPSVPFLQQIRFSLMNSDTRPILTHVIENDELKRESALYNHQLVAASTWVNWLVRFVNSADWVRNQSFLASLPSELLVKITRFVASNPEWIDERVLANIIQHKVKVAAAEKSTASTQKTVSKENSSVQKSALDKAIGVIQQHQDWSISIGLNLYLRAGLIDAKTSLLIAQPTVSKKFQELSTAGLDLNSVIPRMVPSKEGVSICCPTKDNTKKLFIYLEEKSYPYTCSLEKPESYYSHNNGNFLSALLSYPIQLNWNDFISLAQNELKLPLTTVHDVVAPRCWPAGVELGSQIFTNKIESIKATLSRLTAPTLQDFTKAQQEVEKFVAAFLPLMWGNAEEPGKLLDYLTQEKQQGTSFLMVIAAPKDQPVIYAKPEQPTAIFQKIVTLVTEKNKELS